MTKKQLREIADVYLSAASEHRLQDIHAAYRRPSEYKVRIFNRLVKDARIFLRHTPVSVMEHSCQLFTVGYCYIATVNGVDTAYFVYRTAKNGYLLKLEDDEMKTVLKLCV